MAEFDDNQTAVQYGESLLAGRESQQQKNKKRQKKIQRVNMVLAGVGIADKFMAKNAQKKVNTFTKNLNAEKAGALSNYKKASAFNTQLETYRNLNPSINFDDELQYDPQGLIYDAVQTKHAKDTRSQYAKGVQGSFQEATAGGADSSSDWETEVKRRTANSMISLKAAYAKHKGYLNTTDVAITSQYKQILDQGTSDLMSADNTSSIRKLFNKFGITDKNNSDLTNIEAGGIKIKVNEKLAKEFTDALKNNDAATETYNTWLKSKNKKYDTTVTEMKPLNKDSSLQISRFNSFTKAAEGFHGNFYYSKSGVLNKKTFAQADSEPIKAFEKAKDSLGEQPLAQMTLKGVTGPRDFSDLWGKISGDQRRILLDNSEMLYGRELDKEQKILTAESAVGQATGSPEKEVDAMVVAIKATVSFNSEGKYEVKKLLEVEEFNRTTNTGEAIEKYESEGFLLHGGKNTTQMANSYFNIHKNPTISVEQKKNTLAKLKTEIGAQGENKLNHFNEVIEEHGINFDTLVKKDDRDVYSIKQIEAGLPEKKREQKLFDDIQTEEKNLLNNVTDMVLDVRKSAISKPRYKTTLTANEYDKYLEKQKEALSKKENFEKEFGFSMKTFINEKTRSMGSKLKERLEENPDLLNKISDYLTNYDESRFTEEKKNLMDNTMIEDNSIRTGRTEDVSKLINAHITAKKKNGTPRFLITNEEKAIDNLLNKFLPAVIQIESSGDSKAKSSQSSASGLLQFLMPSEEYPNGSAIPALNRVEKYLGKREWGKELREHGDASLLTAEQQVELFIGNILEKTVVVRDLDAEGNIQYNKKGKILTKEMSGLGDKLMQKVFDGDMEGMLEAYYMIHHTNPDEATRKVAEREFKKYF